MEVGRKMRKEQDERHKQTVTNLANDPQKYIDFLEGLVIDVCDLTNLFEEMCDNHNAQGYLSEEEEEELREQDMLVDLGMHLMMDVQNARKS